MIKEYNELRTGLKSLSDEINNHYKEDMEFEEGDNFATIMREFRSMSVSRFEELEVRYTSMDVAYKDVVVYFGEDPEAMKPDEFFSIFKTFTSSWEVCMPPLVICV